MRCPGIVTYGKELKFSKIPHPARGIDVFTDDVRRVYDHASRKLCIFAFLGMLLEDCTCGLAMSETST